MIISVKKLMKRFDDYMVLDRLSLDVEEGEIYGVLGPVGSGKTTLMQCLLTLVSFDKGSIKLFGENLTNMKNFMKKRIGVCFDQNAVFETLSVYDNLYYFGNLYIKNKRETEQAVEQVMVKTGLKEYKKICCSKLDEGRQRLLNFACSIVHNPDLILIDDGFTTCEMKVRNRIYECVRTLRNEGKTILLMTHSVEEAEEICDKIAIMDRGRILAHGTKEELKKSISLGERIRIHVFHISHEQLAGIQSIPGVFFVSYEKEILTVKSKKGRNNLLYILSFLKENEIAIGEIVSELPTLNDVFGELSGRQFSKWEKSGNNK